MAPDTQILTAISREDQNMELQRRLQDHEIQKARNLLAMVTGHKQALDIHKNLILRQIIQVQKADGSSRK